MTIPTKTPALLPTREEDPFCVCCCRPLSEHNEKRQCPETSYFVANTRHSPAPDKGEGRQPIPYSHAIGDAGQAYIKKVSHNGDAVCGATIRVRAARQSR